MASAKSKAPPRPTIVVSTGQNKVAKVLNRYARSFVSSLSAKKGGSTTHLGPPKSVSLRVQSELQKRSDASFFFFGHGVEPPAFGFVGHDSKPAVDRKTVGLLKGRHVGATCCYGNNLGKAAPVNGFSLFGYTDKLVVPLWGEHVGLMEAAFLAGPGALAAGQSAAQAAEVAANAFRRLAQRLQQSGQDDDRIFARVILSNADKVRAWSKENGREDQARRAKDSREGGSATGDVGQGNAASQAKTGNHRNRIRGRHDTIAGADPEKRSRRNAPRN
jgi:hypothetical protein